MLAAAIYSIFSKKLEFMRPSDDQLREIIAENDQNLAHKQVKLQSAFLMPLLVWLFLGNLFWAIGGLIDIVRYRAFEYIEYDAALESVKASVTPAQAFKKSCKP